MEIRKINEINYEELHITVAFSNAFNEVTSV